MFGKVSKFRHLKGTPTHKSTHIENIRNISRQIPGECNGFQANFKRVAVPLSGPGGKIAVYELNKPGRLPGNNYLLLLIIITLLLLIIINLLLLY